jgi:hypothetical protein
MSRRTLITCDLCQQQVPAAAETWRNLDVCPGCLASARPVSEVLAVIRKAVDGNGMFVGPDDVIPVRTRRRQPDRGA